MSRLQSLLRVLLGACVLIGLSGCAGLPISQTVQRGSTILVPLTNYVSTNPMVGYGGTQISDPERGEMQFFLVDPSVTANPPDLDDTSISFEIRPRGSGAAASAPADPSFRAGAPLTGTATLPPVQVVSVLDIPQNAPPGQRVLWVRHLKPDGTTETPVKVGSLWILPSSVSFSENGTSYTVVGTSTPFQGWGYSLTTQQLQSAVPDPTIVIPLPTPVYAAKLLVYFGGGGTPPSLVDAVLPSFNGLRSQLLVKVSQLYAGNSYYSADVVATSPSGFDELDLVFQMNGSTPVNPTPPDVSVVFLKAWDQDGNTILDQNGIPLFDGKSLATLGITPTVR